MTILSPHKSNGPTLHFILKNKMERSVSPNMKLIFSFGPSNKGIKKGKKDIRFCIFKTFAPKTRNNSPIRVIHYLSSIEPSDSTRPWPFGSNSGAQRTSTR